jgi:hypothetical protein
MKWQQWGGGSREENAQARGGIKKAWSSDEGAEQGPGEGRGYLFLGNTEGKIGDVNEILLNDSNVRKILPADLVLLLSLLLLLLLPGELLRDSAIITRIYAKE